MWLRNYLYKRKLKRLARDLQDKLTGVQTAQNYLPVCYPSWVKFWNETKGNHTYVVLPKIEEDEGQWYFTNIPHVWIKEFIRHKAIEEATGEENYELAARIKSE